MSGRGTICWLTTSAVIPEIPDMLFQVHDVHCVCACVCVCVCVHAYVCACVCMCVCDAVQSGRQFFGVPHPSHTWVGIKSFPRRFAFRESHMHCWQTLQNCLPDWFSLFPSSPSLHILSLSLPPSLPLSQIPSTTSLYSPSAGHVYTHTGTVVTPTYHVTLTC